MKNYHHIKWSMVRHWRIFTGNLMRMRESAQGREKVKKKLEKINRKTIQKLKDKTDSEPRMSLDTFWYIYAKYIWWKTEYFIYDFTQRKREKERLKNFYRISYIYFHLITALFWCLWCCALVVFLIFIPNFYFSPLNRQL